MSEKDFKKKYLKYKQKYISLKSRQSGGDITRRDDRKYTAKKTNPLSSKNMVNNVKKKSGSYHVKDLHIYETTLYKLSEKNKSYSDLLRYIRDKYTSTGRTTPFSMSELSADENIPADFFQFDIMVDPYKRIYTYDIQKLNALKEITNDNYFNGVVVITQVNEFKYPIHVNNIKFTQRTISNTFTDKLNTIEKMIHNIRAFGRTMSMQELINGGIDRTFFELDVRTSENGILSCNNRRLCVLKKVARSNNFDGIIYVKKVNNCQHPVEIPNNDDPLIQFGNRPGQTCFNLVT